MKRNKIYAVLFFLVTLIGFSGCEDGMEEITGLSTTRAFSPTDLIATVVNKTSVRLSFKAVNNAKTYTIEVSTNADFSGTPVRSISNITYLQVPYTIAALDGNVQYYIRVKAVGEGIEESKWITASAKTEPEQIFQDLTTGKLTSRAITLNWAPGENVTSITVTPGNISHVITPAEKAAGEVTITGLTPKVTYTATLLLNAAVRGTRIFTTPAELPTGADVVVLAATDDLAAKIQAATTSTRFVILEGTKYNSDVPVVIPAGIDISIIGEVAAVKPIVSFSLITLPVTGGKLHFENVDLPAWANGDVTTAKRQYIINQSSVSAMDQVSFENCSIRGFVNTPLRLQAIAGGGTGTIVINKVIVNNCVVDDIGVNATSGTYAFISTSVAIGRINNISITNSTFSNIGYSLILHSAAPSLSVVVENNTFYNVIGDTRYLIDYNAQTIANGFSFKNNIIGKTLSAANTSRGIRSATAPTVANNYLTSDVTFAGNAIPSTTLYAGASTALYTDPAAKNFKIKDDSFTGKATAGDPRWRP